MKTKSKVMDIILKNHDQLLISELEIEVISEKRTSSSGVESIREEIK